MSVDRKLLGLHLGSLPPGERAQWRDRVAREPHLARRLRAIVARLEDAEAAGELEPPRWLLPLPGQHRGRTPIRATVEVHAWLDLQATRPAPMRIVLHAPPDLDEHRLLLVEEIEGDFHLRAPANGAAPLRVGQLAADGAGRRIDLLGWPGSVWSVILLPPGCVPELVGGATAALERVRGAVADLACEAFTLRLVPEPP